MGKPTDEYYEITIVLKGYTYAFGPLEALGEAGEIADHWTEHCEQLVARRSEPPDSDLTEE